MAAEKLQDQPSPVITPNRKATMLKLDRSPSHSWWWDSHNSPRHSKWLQSNLQELDEKVKEMLRLIEEDADSFAQRAEMYYKKRPELVNLVEEFYRAYRSLAERYDHLTGEIRQNIPKALQVQYGLSCDSPRGPGPLGGRQRYSPLRKTTQLFDGIPKKSANEPSRKGRNGMLSPPSEQAEFYSGPKTPDRESIELSDKDNSQSSDLSSSDSEVDNTTPLNKLQQEIENLEKQNKLLTESHKVAIECNASLQQRIKALEGECECSRRESDELHGKVDELNKSLILLQMENATMKQVDELLANNLLFQMEKVTRQQVDDLLAPSKHVPMLEEEIDCSMNDEEDNCFEKDDVSEGLNGDYYHLYKLCSAQDPTASFLVRSMQAQISVLLEENKRQKLDIVKRGEEKREAIRQLCFTIDIMKSKNERLEMMLRQLKKRLYSISSNVSGNSAPQLLIPAWKRFFMGEWRNSKNLIQPQAFAVAL